MNNEEKILELLSRHEDSFEKINQTLTEMRAGMTEMRAGMTEMKADMAEMKTLLQKVAVTQEGVVLPRLELLAEGHQNLLDTLAPKSRVEALEEDVDTLKTVMRLLTHDVAELKKAQ